MAMLGPFCSRTSSLTVVNRHFFPSESSLSPTNQPLPNPNLFTAFPHFPSLVMPAIPQHPPTPLSRSALTTPIKPGTMLHLCLYLSGVTFKTFQWVPASLINILWESFIPTPRVRINTIQASISVFFFFFRVCLCHLLINTWFILIYSPGLSNSITLFPYHICLTLTFQS